MRQKSPVACSLSHSTRKTQKGANTHVGDDRTLPKRFAERDQAPNRPVDSSVPKEPLAQKAALDEQSHARNLNKRRAVRCYYACTRKSTEQDVHFDIEYLIRSCGALRLETRVASLGARLVRAGKTKSTPMELSGKQETRFRFSRYAPFP